MSLSEWEQQDLDSIKDRLAGSDPGLTALLATFTRLASGEDMPVREKIPPATRRSRRKRRHPRRGTMSWHTRRVHQQLGFQAIAMLLWLLITVTLIASALLLGRGGSQTACTVPWAAVCAGSSPAPSPGAATDKTASLAPSPGNPHNTPIEPNG
ncbi:MAG TPA: hypothetical protein VLW50_24075 [Streptosporangiaceae bacterium]|nr:hypothetical protein [Streptosporangiaceae bacterium]